MALEAYLANLQAQASCPICLDHLRDPVTTECGHNFCSSCIHQRWEGLQGTFPCPVCLHYCPDRRLKRNPQICHMTEIVQQSSTMRGKRKRQEEPLCKKHREVLVLFCEKDLELLCAQCRVSSDHGDQSMIPIEEAVASYRRILKGFSGILTNNLEIAEMISTQQDENTSKVKGKMVKWRQELHCECNQFLCSLELEKYKIGTDLLIKQDDAKKKLIENKKHISNHMFRLSNLLSETEENCLQTDLDLLIGIESNHNSYENLEPPGFFACGILCDSKKDSFFLLPNYLGLHKMLRIFQVDLTLNPETAHPSLIISRKRKSVRYRTSFGLRLSRARTSYPAVLSHEGFEAGRHFWQVEIRGTGELSLGVCKESFPRNTLISPSPNNGCWIHTFGPSPISQRKIGIFVDYELGEVSFYDLNNYSYMYRITATFTGKLTPFFSIASSSESLLIRIIRV